MLLSSFSRLIAICGCFCSAQFQKMKTVYEKNIAGLESEVQKTHKERDEHMKKMSAGGSKTEVRPRGKAASLCSKKTVPLVVSKTVPFLA